MRFSRACASLAALAAVDACLLPEESAHGFDSSKLARRQGSTGIAVGTGDRFKDGAFPRGLGTQPPGTNLTSLLSAAEVRSGFYALAKEYGFETFESPYKTFENATIFGGKVGGVGNCTDAFRVYLNGNIHARERGSADNILYFISDLLYAQKHGTGLQYGGRTYTNCDVRRALAAGIVFTPLSNPDGVAYDQRTNSCWRKNRNPAAAIPGNAASVGIDLNRNFDFLWDFLKEFEPNVGPNVASQDPRAQTYHGSAPFSEPETKSIKWVMDTFSKIRWFIDLHSYTGVVLYNWGSDENQANKPYMNFQNSSYDSVRGLMPDNPQEGIVYAEYLPSKDWSDKVYSAMRTANAMDAATGRHYEAEQSSYLYPTSGASDDYAYSRHFADSSLNKIHGFTIEFGFGNEQASCPFYPTPEQYNLNMLEVNAAFMEFLLSATEIGLGDETSCSA